MRYDISEFTFVKKGLDVSIDGPIGPREIRVKIIADNVAVRLNGVFIVRVHNYIDFTIASGNCELSFDKEVLLWVSDGETVELVSYGDSFIEPMSRNSVDPVYERMAMMMRKQALQFQSVLEEVQLREGLTYVDNGKVDDKNTDNEGERSLSEKKRSDSAVALEIGES